MKKIMFNDKYGLTQAVLEGRKTQTRRIVPESALNDWEIHDKYHNLSEAVGHRMDFEYFLSLYARYEVGEEVAVAQSYKSVADEDHNFCIPNAKGFFNKMFVKADLMPHRIKITNIRIERLQDISEDDCLNEGLEWTHGIFYVCYNKETGSRMNLGNDYHNAFATLIDKISGKGTWESNPLVFVYDFELVK